MVIGQSAKPRYGVKIHVFRHNELIYFKKKKIFLEMAPRHDLSITLLW
jgi:hypothetical protein